MKTEKGITTIIPEDIESEAKRLMQHEKQSLGLSGRIHSVRWHLTYGNQLTLHVVGRINPNHFLESSITL